MHKHTLREWFISVRPWSFTASAMPIIVTFCYLLWSGREPSPWMALWALAGIILFHASGNTWSDYFDYRHGVDAADTYGVTTITSGMFTAKEIYWISLVLFVVASASGLAMLACTGWTVLWIGLGGALCSLLYPYFKFHALGDVIIFTSYALLPALGTSFVTTGALHFDTLYAVIPVGFITVGILHVNNTRDIASDRRAGIKTLAMNVGPRAAVVIYFAELFVPFVLVALGTATGLLPLYTLIIFLTLPVAIANASTMRSFLHQGSNTVIAALDQRTAALQMMYALTLSLGLLCAWILS